MAGQLGIAPILEYLRDQPTVFGVPGAGTKPCTKNDINQLCNKLTPYSLTGTSMSARSAASSIRRWPLSPMFGLGVFTTPSTSR